MPDLSSLSPEEQAALVARAQSFQQQSAPPAPMPQVAPPPAPPLGALPPWAEGNAAPPPGDFAGGGPGTHQPPGFRAPSPSGVGADQTYGYTGPRDMPGNMMAPMTPPEPQKTITSGSSVTKGVHFAPDTLAARAAAVQAQQQADAVRAQAAQQSRTAEQQGMSDKAAVMQGNAEAARIQGDRDAEELNNRRAHVASMFDAVQNDKIDPDHWWHSAGTSQKLGAGLAMIAGGMLAGIKGGENQGAKMINDLINRDIEAQKENHAAKREGAQGAMSMYNLAAAGIHDKEQRDTATRAALQQAAILKIDAQTAKEQDPAARAALLDTQASLKMSQAQELSKLDEAASDKVTSHSSSTVQSGGPSAAQQGGLPADRVVKGPDGRMYMLPDAKSAAEYRESAAIAARLKASSQKVEALSHDTWGMPLTDSKAAAEAATADLTNSWMDLKKKRVPADQLREQADAAIGAPDSIFGSRRALTPVRMKMLRENADQHLSDDLSGYGAVPLDVNAGYAVQGGRPVVMGSGVPYIPTVKTPTGKSR